jgi:hypothetical protein
MVGPDWAKAEYDQTSNALNTIDFICLNELGRTAHLFKVSRINAATFDAPCTCRFSPCTVR